jgi:hypothetical protein
MQDSELEATPAGAPRRGSRRFLGSARRHPRVAALAGFLAGLLLAALLGLFVVAPLALTHRTFWPFENRFGRFALKPRATIAGPGHALRRPSGDTALRRLRTCYPADMVNQYAVGTMMGMTRPRTA